MSAETDRRPLTLTRLPSRSDQYSQALKDHRTWKAPDDGMLGGDRIGNLFGQLELEKQLMKKQELDLFWADTEAQRTIGGEKINTEPGYPINRRTAFENWLFDHKMALPAAIGFSAAAAGGNACGLLYWYLTNPVK